MTQNVIKCARCGGNHPGLEFKRMTRPMTPDNAGGVSWQFWAPCPTTNEPIMLSEQRTAVGVAKGDQRQDAPVGGVGHD